MTNIRAMPCETLIPSSAFAEAKSHLSKVMDDVVHGHHPQLVDRHSGRDRMLLMGVTEAAAMLEQFRFEPRVRVSEDEVVVRLPELNLIAGGATYDEALEGLLDLVEEYSADFISRFDFYMQTNRRDHLPWLLRFAITPPEHRAELFFEPPRDALRRVPAAA
jgi:hypothetical protein